MTFQEYLDYFEQILASPEDYDPYGDEEYLNYTKLNWSRMNRWLKRFEPNDAIKSLIASMTEPQHWIVITEPWCGDAAHSVAQLYQIVKNNPNIDFEIQLRDKEPFLIEDYLTNGSKSIPKLIIRNDVGHDKFIWGPRPQPLQDLYMQMKVEGKAFAEINEVIQKWYNEDKGEVLQRELLTQLS
ncbi:thioredoxin family protein [Sphingobacterium corticibacterium]|uniref:Thioredoxin family protein n=1 Tax=Sphingobacterium corticibacterium TaxID=2484746 RepID=A0A4Q6XPY5_9SPHI|nr:thioredoxin family protein [Sphingobacterium corticibacterium]RZF58477.1 thioredoxin family protein [Sphingobacterium corticibacterium]